METMFESLARDTARIQWFDQVMTAGYQTSDPVWYSLHNLLKYISYNSWQLIDHTSMDGNEAVKTAAETVFWSLNKHLTQIEGRADSLDRRLRGMDQFIRVAHQIEPYLYPIDHEDPIVGAFYDTFTYRLGRMVSNITYSPQGDYVRFQLDP